MVFKLKRVWNYFSDGGSLWVALLKANVFTNHCCWTMADSQRVSPNVRSMIRARESVAEFLRCSVGDGCTASFWYDYWTDLGPLILDLCAKGPHDLRINLESPVISAAVDGN